MKLYSFKLILAIGILVGLGSCSKKGCTDPTSLAFSAEAKKDDGSCTYPTSIKKALVFKKTATWCQYCGDWGTTYANNISSTYAKAQVITLHINDAFESAEGDLIVDALAPSGVPHFYAGTTDVPNSYNTLSNTVNAELNEVNDVALAMESSVSGSSMNVKVQSQWQVSASTNGVYYLAVYLLEDGLIKAQTLPGGATDPGRIHNHVLRKEASSTAFGKQITITNTSTGKGFLESFSIPLNSTWVKANCYPVAVLWKKNGSDFNFVNLVVND